MVLDSILASPHRRSPSFRKQFSRDDSLSWPTLIQRHRFLLTALALLAFLCTVYLYFAVTFTATGSCSGLNGTQKALCRLEHAKAHVGKGKLKILWHVDDNYSWEAFPSLVLILRILNLNILLYYNRLCAGLELNGPESLYTRNVAKFSFGDYVTTLMWLFSFQQANVMFFLEYQGPGHSFFFFDNYCVFWSVQTLKSNWICGSG